MNLKLSNWVKWKNFWTIFMHVVVCFTMTMEAVNLSVKLCDMCCCLLVMNATWLTCILFAADSRFVCVTMTTDKLMDSHWHKTIWALVRRGYGSCLTHNNKHDPQKMCRHWTGLEWARVIFICYWWQNCSCHYDYWQIDRLQLTQDNKNLGLVPGRYGSWVDP